MRVFGIRDRTRNGFLEKYAEAGHLRRYSLGPMFYYLVKGLGLEMVPE